MKKTICVIVLMLSVFALASCSKKPATLDLDAAQKAVDDLGVYGALFVPDDDMLISAYGIDNSLIKKGFVAMPVFNIQASLYMIVLPQKGKEAEVKTQLDDFIKQHEKIWETYLPEQHALVKSRLETTLDTREGTYYIYIISENNEKVLEAIKTGLKY